MIERPKEHLLDELRVVEENSLQASQAQQDASRRKALLMRALLVASSLIAATGGILVLVGLPAGLGALSAAGGLVVAIAVAFAVDNNSSLHNTAGIRFSDLAQEARTLRETFAHEIDHPMLVSEVRRTTDKYRNLIHFSPSTDDAQKGGRARVALPALAPLPPPRAVTPPPAPVAPATPEPAPLDFPPIGDGKPIKGPFD
jgi:hypothetical protein